MRYLRNNELMHISGGDYLFIATKVTMSGLKYDCVTNAFIDAYNPLNSTTWDAIEESIKNTCAPSGETYTIDTTTDIVNIRLLKE